MPTVPASPASPAPHQARAIAESFGADPARYDRSRPRYPQDLVARIIAASPGRDVLDVGIGPGVSARPFQSAGCRVLGVEADGWMAAFARARGFEVEAVGFEDWDPARRMFDLVIAGMTWHWIDPVAGAEQAARVLRAAGRLAVFWNLGQPPAPLTDAFADIYRDILPDTPFVRPPSDPLVAYEPIFRRTAQGIQQGGAFGEPERWRHNWEQAYTRDQWLERVPTFGGHSQIPPAAFAELLARQAAAIEAVGGGFTMRHVAVAVTARRR